MGFFSSVSTLTNPASLERPEGSELMTLDLLSTVGVLGDANAAIGVQPWHATAESFRRGHALGSRRPDWSYPSAQWVSACEALGEGPGRTPKRGRELKPPD